MPINADRILISPPSEPDLAANNGGTDAWYGMAYANTLRMLVDHGVRVEEIAYPEQFKSAAFARSRGLGDGAYVHLIFRSADEIRPIPGYYNVGCFGWGFEVLKQTGRAQDLILDDHLRMLSMCDEVWAPSTFVRTIAAEHGVEAHLLPAPVFPPDAIQDRAEALRGLPFSETVGLVTFTAGDEAEYSAVVEKRRRSLGRQEALARALRPSGRVFLTICDPSDTSENFANLVEGFLIATQKRENAVLIVRVLGAGVPGAAQAQRAGIKDAAKSLTLGESLFRQVRPMFGHPHCLSEDRVLLVSDASLGEDAGSLYGLADFYLTASMAEAQNIPLLEAMGQGCVPVSTATTGMADYIGPECGIVMAHRRFTGVVPGLAAEITNKAYAVDYADRYQVAEAVSAALASPPAEYARKQAAAREAVLSSFASDVLFPRFIKRLRQIDPGFSAESLMAEQQPQPSRGRELKPTRPERVAP